MKTPKKTVKTNNETYDEKNILEMKTKCFKALLQNKIVFVSNSKNPVGKHLKTLDTTEKHVKQQVCFYKKQENNHKEVKQQEKMLKTC